MPVEKPVKVFVTFVTPFLYGMERSVIERFSSLMPEIAPHFFMTNTTRRLRLPVLKAVEEAQIPHSFLSDKKDWPTPRRPRTLREALSIMIAVIRSNWDTLLASRGHDVFYVPSLRAIYSVIVTILWYRIRRRAVVYGFHDTLHGPSRLLRLTGPLISDYVFHSHYTKHMFENHNPWATSRNSRVIPNVVKYCPTSVPSPLQTHGRCILFLGQIAKYKGADLLIDAFLQIEDAYQEVTLHFVGDIHEEFHDQFVEAISREDLRGRILHWGYRNDRHEFLKAAYVCVQASRPSMFAEALSRVANESMAAGVPVVCFRSGSLPEQVIDGETGLVCAEETVECLADNLRRLLDDTDLRNRLAANALERYQTLYSVDVVREQWVDFFQELNTKK